MFAGHDTLLSVAKGGKPSHPLVLRATELWRNRLHTKTQFKPKVGFGTMFPRYATSCSDIWFSVSSLSDWKAWCYVWGDSMTNDCGQRTNFRRKTIN